MKPDHFIRIKDFALKKIHSGFFIMLTWLSILQVPGKGYAQGIIREFSADYSSIAGMIRFMESPERERWQKPEEVISLFGSLKGKTILDLGSGTGYFTFRLARKADKVIAADVDERYLSYLNENMLKPEFADLSARIELRKIPYENPGLKEEEADGILIVNTYHHIENRVEYFKKAITGLKPGGRIIIVEYIKGIDFGPSDDHKTDINEALKELNQVGFSDLTKITNLLEYQFIIVCKK